MPEVAILSQELDIHARSICKNLNDNWGVKAHFISTDAFIRKGGINWQSGGACSEIKTDDSSWIDISDQDLIWWRRVNQPLKELEGLEEGELKDFITNEWRSAFFGLMHDAFKGVWVNKPRYDAIAGNKLFQLNVAASCGFEIPRTIVTQEFEEVRRFCENIDGRIIAKKLMGTRHAPLATIEIDPSELSREQVSLCPAIYQEFIEADHHLRVNVFGKDAFAFLIESSVMDWRRDMKGRFEVYDLPKEIAGRLRDVLDMLSLEMGVFDMIVRKDGSLVWLEMNTQGQFLFCEGKTGSDLTSVFCNFLVETAKYGSTLGKRGELRVSN